MSDNAKSFTIMLSALIYYAWGWEYLDFIYDNIGTVSIIVINYVVIPFVHCTVFWFWTKLKHKFSVGIMIWIPVILINRMLDFVWEPFLWLMASAVISLCVLKIMEWLMAQKSRRETYDT